MDKIISAEEFNKRYGSVSQNTSAPMTLSAQEFQAKYGGQPATPKPTGMEKASNILGGIFGGQKIGEAIGTKIAKSRFNKSPLAGALTEQQKAETFNMPTGKQIAGDIGRVALNFAPVSKIATGAKAGATALGAGAKLAKPISQIATGGAVGYGADVTTKLAEGQEDPFKAGIGTAVGTGIGALPVVGAGAKAVGKAVLPKSENIMNRVVRLTPTDANKFEKIAGKKHGQYLTETGNIFAPEKVAEKEATKFVNSLKEADDALATLPGNYKTGAIDDMLDELVMRENRVSSPNVPSKDSARANFLASKHKTVGLNMSEINEAKRLFERNVKLGYNKLLESDKVDKATEIDNAVREWQFKKADDLGLKNLREINKQTQISRFLVDKIGKQLTGKSGNEAVNLTDWIILSGGDPTAVSAFLVKKTLSNKNVQAGAARLLAPRPFKKPVTAQFGGKTGLPAKIEGVDYSLPKPNNPKYQPIKLPESVRETNLGLDEVRGTIRSKPTLQLPAKTESGKAYTNTILPKNTTSKSVGKTGLSLKDQRGFIATGYKGESDLTTKILKDLEGKTTVSKQYILDATNRGELKQVERDLIREVLSTEKGDTINVSDFAKKVKAELLPLKVSKARDMYSLARGGTGGRYENITLPDDLRGNVKNYEERIYESPIKTSAGDVHFGQPKDKVEGYFGHTRIEDMADNKTRRVIEVQSDLYQKGNLERESSEEKILNIGQRAYLDSKGELKDAVKAESQAIRNRQEELQKLAQYNDPTAHFRMIREEIKKAAQDGKTKLQFPTGETAMKIEGLGDNVQFYDVARMNETRANGMASDLQRQGEALSYATLKPTELKVGQEVSQGAGNHWIITDVLGDGKFKAVPKEKWDDMDAGVFLYSQEEKRLNELWNKNQTTLTQAEKAERDALFAKADQLKESFQFNREIPDTETFDISGKVDTNNPIYRFYEKDVQKYLNKFGGKRVVDDKGVSWIEVPIKKEYGDQAVEAFGKIGVSPLFIGAGVGAGSVVAGGVINKKLGKKPPKLK